MPPSSRTSGWDPVSEIMSWSRKDWEYDWTRTETDDAQPFVDEDWKIVSWVILDVEEVYKLVSFAIKLPPALFSLCSSY